MKHDPSTSAAASPSPETSRSDAGLPGYSTSTADLDAVFAALSHPRRRYLLSALATHDGERPLTCLATDVVAWEHDQPREDVCTEALEHCCIALHHVHLPKLAALGVVDYDSDGDRTVRAADTDQVDAVLDALADELDTTLEAPLERDGA